MALEPAPDSATTMPPPSREGETLMEARTRTGIRLLLAVAAVALCTWVALDDPAAIAAQSNFVGGEPSRPDSSDIRALRLRFEAGSRSNWHSHANWQILMAEEGRGRT